MNATDVTDAGAVRRHLATIRAANRLVFHCVVGMALYLVLTPAAHRPLALGLLGAATVVALTAAALPLEPIMRSKVLRERFYLAWSTALLAVQLALIALDGGAKSPLAVMMLVQLAFVGMTYPTWLVLTISALSITGYGAVALIVGDVLVGEALVKIFALAGVAGICAWTGRTNDERRAELARMSRTDALTGALNRRGFEEQLFGELARAQRAGAPLSLVQIDLDRFKEVNDTDGHAAGDAVLQRTATALRDAVRPADVVGRLGGDEFAVVLPDADAARAERVVRRLRAAMADVSAVSFGVASFPADGDTAEALYHRADAALYAAKRTGRRTAVDA